MTILITYRYIVQIHFYSLMLSLITIYVKNTKHKSFAFTFLVHFYNLTAQYSRLPYPLHLLRHMLKEIHSMFTKTIDT